MHLVNQKVMFVFVATRKLGIYPTVCVLLLLVKVLMSITFSFCIHFPLQLHLIY